MKLRALVLALFLVLPAVKVGYAQDVPSVVRFSFSSGWDGLPAIVAIERGFFANENLVVSSMPLSNTKGIIESLAGGSTDFATVPQRTLLIMAAAKVPVKVVSQNGWGAEIELIVPASDTATKSLAELKGKTIAVGSGSESHGVLIRLLNQSGLQPNDVNVKIVPSPQLTSAFDGNAAQAIFALRYFTSPLVSTERARVVLSNDAVVQAIGRIGASPLVVSGKTLEHKPETIQRFVNAWVRALDYVRSDPDDAANLLRVYFHRQGVKVSKELTRSWVDMVRYDRYTWSEADVLDAEYNGWGLNTGKVFKVQPKLEGYIDNRYAEAAAKNLK
ncbi:MAG: ABC transporter substrate-binding protein [Kiloniellales bacterium]|nr:ABC transporter substrate-binding protein [Kiloniellales bacterium]